ncbi:hypothetical protein AQUCO_02600002v1 [Aquilegia coerulea]|uniref:non-specific serine/threonine protein kinase n=1 Tax=Aquilegia coerulea TaxID=218851 RepID=A0A2G5D6Y0_AQUCA|nr:hypothetical protein AQUCO_02600002v1 [Aquilegia coerulea]
MVIDQNSDTVEKFFDEWEKEKPKKFTPEQLWALTSGFSKSLDSGSCGYVFKGIYNGQKVAVKVLKEEILGDDIKDQFMAEVSTLGNTHHRNLVKLYGFCFQPKMKALVYEFMEKKSLDKVLYGKSSIKSETLCNIAIGTAKGLSYLHEDCQPSIIHYDIKPSNILLDSRFSPKIGDFGMARLLKMDATHVTMSKFRGTPYYCAPELSLPYLKVNHKCDVYSYGMMLFDIVSMRKHERQDAEHWFPRKVWDKYQKGKLEEVMADCIEAKDRKMAKRILIIALSCVEFWDSDRPSMKDVVRLLEGTKEPQMRSNHFLSSLQASASTVAPDRNYRNVKIESVLKWRNFNPLEEKQNIGTSRETINRRDEEKKAFEGNATPIQRQQQEHAIKQDVHGQSHFPLFLFSLVLILFLKYYFDSFFIWIRKTAP